MKNLFIFSCFIFVFLNSLLSQSTTFTLHLQYGDNRDITPELYGVHISGFFDRCRCYDPWEPESSVDSIDECMALAATLKPLILRFPTGGQNKFVHLLDGPGYGYKEADIDSALARGYMTTGDATGWYNDITDQFLLNPDSAKYIDRLIDFVQYSDSVNGFAPKIIFVANLMLHALFPDVYTNVTDENLAAIRYLIDNGIEIAGIEMGNEHYDGDDTLSNFIVYWNVCKPLLDSLNADTALNTIKVSLCAAPEPDAAEALNFNTSSVNQFKTWNNYLKSRAVHPVHGLLFDAYTVHIYNTHKQMEPCYELYTEDYYDTDPDYNISFSPADTILTPIWECARDSMETFTNIWVKKMFQRYDDGCSYCLGTSKEYWVTEWGVKPATASGNAGEGGSTTLTGGFNNTFIDAGYTLMFQLMLTDIDAANPATNITISTRHTEIAGFNYGLISHAGQLDIESEDTTYIKRAAYFPFVMMQDIYLKNFDRVISTVNIIEGDNPPFIKTYVDTTLNMFYVYYYNPTTDTIYLNRDSITADTSAWGFGDPNPESGGGKLKYIVADQLYSHSGANQYMKDNSFYNSAELQPLIDSIFSQNIGIEALLTFPPNSIGYANWQLSPGLHEIRLAGQLESEIEKLTLGPNPAAQQINFYLKNADESNYTLEIYSITGSAITILPIKDGYAQLQKSNLASGIYFYRLVANNKRIGSGKFIFN